MSDEACPEFMSFIQNAETGLEYLQENFGVRPKVAWQIDPFGLSAITPSIYAKLGYEGLVISRIGTETEKQLSDDGDLEFVWQGLPIGDDPKENELFTHVL